jgi:hypothetical protein
MRGNDFVPTTRCRCPRGVGIRAAKLEYTVAAFLARTLIDAAVSVGDKVGTGDEVGKADVGAGLVKLSYLIAELNPAIKDRAI